MNRWLLLIPLSLIDFIIIWIWVKNEDPDPSLSIAILLLVPLVVILNLIVAGILYFTKRAYAKLFVANSLIAAVLMNLLFTDGIHRHQSERFETWNFQLKDTIYRINFHKPDSSFSISYSTNPGSSTSYVYGRVKYKSDGYLLLNDTMNLTIRDNCLFGFHATGDSILLTQEVP